MALIFVLVIVFFSIIPFPAGAYIDPGTGSWFIQVAAATLLGVLLSVKLMWRHIVRIFGKRNASHFSQKKNPTSETNQN